MAFRDDISIDWAVTPRIITVAAPSTSVLVQDLIDTLRTLESKVENLDKPSIVDASGKDELGVEEGITKKVGITLVLLDARLKFEDRVAGATPVWTLCKVYGGNLIAKDWGGATPSWQVVENPLADADYVNAIIAQSSSPTIVYASGGSPAEIAQAVWESASRTLTGFGTLVADIWSYGTRTLTSLSSLVASIAIAVWDRILTAGTHNIPASAGRRLRQLGDVVNGSVVDPSPTTVRWLTDLTNTIEDFYSHQYVRFISGQLTGMVRIISHYEADVKAICLCTGEALPQPPENGDEFEILPVHLHTIDDIGDVVWDELMSEHTVVGSAGAKLQNIETVVELLKQIGTGRWKVVNNQLIYYEDDNETEIIRFNLFGKDGQPTEDSPYERRRV